MYRDAKVLQIVEGSNDLHRAPDRRDRARPARRRRAGGGGVKVAVLGGGIMGNGIAQLAAMAGDDAVVRDVDDAALERARAAIETSLGRFVRKERLTAGGSGGGARRASASPPTWPRRVDGADVVIEAVPEVLDLKRAVWRDGRRARARGRAARHQHLAALDHRRSRSRSVTRRRRLVGIHFFNPPVMMRLVEVIAGTADDARGGRACPRVRRAPRQGGRGLPQGQPGLHHEPRLRDPAPRVHPHARGGHRERGGHRHRAQARVQLPDGAARARRHERPRHVLARRSAGWPRRTATGSGRRSACATWSRPTASAGRPAPASTTTTRTAGASNDQQCFQVGRALFDEGGQPLDRVARIANAMANARRSATMPGASAGLRRLLDGFLREPLGNRRPVGDLRRHLLRDREPLVRPVTRDTRPARSASTASSRRPVRIMSMASALPTARGSICVPPAPGMRPEHGLRQPEARGLGGDDDVGDHRELAAAAEAQARDGRDDAACGCCASPPTAGRGRRRRSPAAAGRAARARLRRRRTPC